ncbi:aminotransferase class IV [Fulvivirga sp. 29W222]|uniref:branched-chain-amino-acid transaminase n=1 Tax=Fulvivirga marina TaxID=2494733 RepID=A0A937G2R8_9BACT|nr:aminotransferase class IV [Fulvivirga marina]MBL6448973.1 aminotransferase class IV [Fulvivirga marina]
MAAIFNNKYITDHFSCAINDRALQFGDGLFETIKVENGKAQLLNYHLDRLNEGAEALRFKLPNYLTEELLQSQIAELRFHNQMDTKATAKLLVWRKNNNQRAYASVDRDVNTLLMLKPSSATSVKKNVGYSKDVILHYWKLSRFKTLNALPYIIATQERDIRKLDELILLNVHGQVTECTSSNIFWMKDNVYYTPSLLTGCIAGIQRRHIFDVFKAKNIQYFEVEEGPEALSVAEGVFICNSNGLYPITNINKVTYYKSIESIKKLT